MPSSPKAKTVQYLVTYIDELIRRFGSEAGGLSLRGKVLLLVDMDGRFKELGVTVVTEHFPDARSARERIRLYLIENAGHIIDGRELAVVSGISEYARRIRELRVEQGYRILTGASNDPNSGVSLRPDDYLLVTTEADTDAARRWIIANRIRKSSQGSKARLLEYFHEMVGRIVTTEELAYIAKSTTEFPRRVRELRTEEGYPIATRFTGRPDLRMGEYVLLSTERRIASHDRHIPAEVEREVYERDQNSCRVCGWNIERWSQADPRILELHHFEHHAEGGANVASNLLVLCSRCHDEVHAGRRECPNPVP
jgi:hypothetical protein